VDGMDTKWFQGWDGRQQFLRKVMHVECEEEKVQMVQSLIEEAKQSGAFNKMFGRNARASCVLEVRKGSVAKKEKQRAQSKVDSAALASICRRHINYMSSTIYHGLTGIINVDKCVPIYSTTDPTKEVGHFTFRHLLYNKFVMSDGQPLFWEVHQAEPMCPVDVVIPNWPEAERLVLMMNKNVAAFTKHFLGDKTKIDKEYLDGFVRETVYPEVVSAARDCEWDASECSLTTKEDREMANLQEIEAAAWYQDEWGDHMEDERKGKRQYANQEELNDLNSLQTFKSVHQKQGNASKSAKVKSFQVGGEKSGGEEEPSSGSEGSSAKAATNAEDLNKMSKEELIAFLLNKSKISRKTAGSPPDNEDSAAETGRGADEDESSESSSSSSESEDSESEMSEDSSPPSAGGVATGSTSARGG
jgi:hypothetical protein